MTSKAQTRDFSHATFSRPIELYVIEFQRVMESMSRRGTFSHQDLQREFHTLKAGAALFQWEGLTEALEAFENRLKIEDLTHESHRAILRDEAVRLSLLLEETLLAQDQSQSSSSDLQMAIIEPLHGLARAAGKILREVKIEGDLEQLAKGPYGGLLVVLSHAFRNAIDHGIETPEVRLGRGKPEGGKIGLRVHESEVRGLSEFVIEISDDGAGVDVDGVRRLLKVRSPKTKSSDHKVIQAIFGHGVSLRQSKLSGRGFGLSAIEREAKKLGGTVSVSTSRNFGTTVSIRIPKALTIRKAS